MKRMLMVASVPSMIGQFNMSNIDILQELGYRVEVACNFRDRSVWDDNRVQDFIKELKQKKIKTYQIDFSRNSKSILQHIKSYQQLNLLVKKRKYDFIHCHTPIAGAITRLITYKNKIKVIYTAHGFHFFKGAPLQNWILYYPIEKFLAKYTDILITINKEDYIRAKNFKAKKIEYVPGVGIDIEKFKNCKIDIEKKKEELGIYGEAQVLLSVGELNRNKNHISVIKMLSKLNRKDIYYLICGKGKEEDNLKNIAKQLGVEKQVILAGFRNDIKEIYHIADIFVFPSKREGISVALMEAMASGLPCVVSKIRGNIDLIDIDKGGKLFNLNNLDEMKKVIEDVLTCSSFEKKNMGSYNMSKVEKFSLYNVKEKIKNIYYEIN